MGTEHDQVIFNHICRGCACKWYWLPWINHNLQKMFDNLLASITIYSQLAIVMITSYLCWSSFLTHCHFSTFFFFSINDHWPGKVLLLAVKFSNSVPLVERHMKQVIAMQASKLIHVYNSYSPWSMAICTAVCMLPANLKILYTNCMVLMSIHCGFS